MATEKFNLIIRPNNKNLQIKNYKNSHEIRLTRPQMQHTNPQHMYLKFLTPLAQSVEKIVSLLHGFKSVYKPRNINGLFSQCGS
jgi:hypothetical protein